MTECLTCAEIETQICDLIAELRSLGVCDGMKVSEDGTTFDYSAGISSKQSALKALRELYSLKCKGANELYEFVQIPCVKPATCVGVGCSNRTSRLNRRRYRR